MEFKKLELDQPLKGMHRKLSMAGLKRTLAAFVIGAVAGFLLFWLAETNIRDSIGIGDILRSAGVGGLFGIFVANSPCARNRC